MAFGFPAKYSETVEYPGATRDAVRNAAAYAFDILGWEYVESSSGDFVVRTGINLNSWGERFTVSLLEPGCVMVESRCLFFQVFDWGDNKRSVERFLAHFEGRLTRNILEPKPEPEHFDANGRTPVGRIIGDVE